MAIRIMRGIPGSGKSTHVRRHANSWDLICSADSFFQEGEEYKFDPSKLSEAHGECLRNFTLAMVESNVDIWVDNTNLTAWEISPYMSLALAYGRDVEILQFNVTPEVAFSRQIHGVPAPVIQRMARSLREERLPPFWKVKHV